MNNLKFVVLAITGQLTISLLLAVLVTSKTRLSDFLKTVYFIPLLTSSVAVATLWSFIYHPTFGLLNAFLEKLGLDFLILDWLGSSKSALYAVIAAINWRFIPFYMILFIAAIVGIPKRLYEAAEIDGASAFQSFWYITLPQLKNTIINATVLILVGSLKYFDIVFTMTQGGPNHSSELLATYMYLKTFFDFRMGYGSAIAVSLFILAFVTSFVLLKLTKKDIRN
ncbi:MAG: carbohydrate ABC transporter permease [Halanaerobiales bacterium]